MAATNNERLHAVSSKNFRYYIKIRCYGLKPCEFENDSESTANLIKYYAG